MPRVSFRTLTLMMLLLMSVLAHQYVSWTSIAHADALWLVEDDPNEPTDPEPEFSAASLGLLLQDDDPNEPQPEMIGWAFGQSRLEDDPNEPQPEMIGWAFGQSRLDDDPNEPQPELVGWAFGLSGSDDDPNEPSEPGPEFA